MGGGGVGGEKMNTECADCGRMFVMYVKFKLNGWDLGGNIH